MAGVIQGYTDAARLYRISMVCTVSMKPDGKEQALREKNGIPGNAALYSLQGTYEGTAETPRVKVTVEVTVQAHKLKDIQLLRHESGQGAPAEVMILDMLNRNTSEVDTVTGATMSSKAIRAAVRDALAKGAAN